MFHSIKLTNFRRHRDATFQFTDGLNIIKGANEASKTTILEALAYALFGVKALRTPLCDTVTYDEQEATLRVTVVMMLNGTRYEVGRGKSGALLTYIGGKVTGQTEVTSYVAGLLKADAGIAAKLMMAPQGEIRGALESGAKATTELIEKLAEFDQLDRLIELMQSNWTLGSTQTLEIQIQAAEETLEECKVVEPDFLALKAAIRFAEDKEGEARKTNTAEVRALDFAHEAFAKAQVQDIERKSLKSQVVQVLDRLTSVNEDIVRCEGVKEPWNLEQDLLWARAAIEWCRNQARVKPVWEEFQSLSSLENLPEDFKGSEKHLDLLIERWTENAVKSALDLEKTKGEINLLTSQLLRGACTFCGKDFSAVPEVIKRNEESQQELERLKERKENYASLEVSQRSMVDELKKIREMSKPRLKLLRDYPDLVVQEGESLPPNLKWMGPTEFNENEKETVQKYEDCIKRLHAEQKAFDQAQAQLSALTAERARLTESCERLQLQVLDVPEVDFEAARKRLNEAKDRAYGAQNTFRQASQAVEQAKHAKAEAEQAYRYAVAKRASAAKTLEEKQQELALLNFNNTLMKKVRSARPVIAWRLWSLLLGTVGTYLSQIRGVQSEVSKDGDGFKVNGKLVAALSGSTLDALGLAIRVALVRTFLPMVDFLILDEPGAAMDVERTERLLGFLSAVGFRQILLVTHENISADVADNTIVLV